MRYFVLEVHRGDGEHYPPRTIRSLLSGLNCILRSNSATFSLLDKCNPAFRELLLTLDTVTSSLHSQGISAARNSASVIPFEHENIMWEKHLLGSDTPQTLQRAVFYGVGLNFVLRGVDEQHSLQVEQLVRHPLDQSVYSSDVYYEYTELISKNNQHRFKDVNSSNKCVRTYAQPGYERCLVWLLDLYISKLPPNPVAFYLRPLTCVPDDPTKPWYSKC